jgi:hypothetical protein
MNENGNENTGVEIAEVISVGVLESLEKASIDMQIATAKRFPRSIATFQKRSIECACIDEDTAASCLYRRPVGKDKGGEEIYVEGMSIRLAEIVGANYGNLRVGARIISKSEREVVAQGVAHDLETNFYSSSEVIESTVDKYGKPFSERMRVVVAKAALAKARRDATFQVVPRAMAIPVQAAIKSLLFGKTESLSMWRERIAAWIKVLGIDERRVFAAVGVSGLADMVKEHVEQLLGIKTALQNGDATLDEAFPELTVKENTAAKAAELKDRLNGKKEGSLI